MEVKHDVNRGVMGSTGPGVTVDTRPTGVRVTSGGTAGSRCAGLSCTTGTEGAGEDNTGGRVGGTNTVVQS